MHPSIIFFRFIPNRRSSPPSPDPNTPVYAHISTAGTEASGTSNMKFQMNGCLIIGTLDGANVEIREQVGADNFFLFGKTTPEIEALRKSGYRPWELLEALPELQEVLHLVEQGHFSNGDTELFRPLVDNLRGQDPFFVFADFAAYLDAQDNVSEAWGNRQHWNRMSLLNSARTGYFSSDRSVREYCDGIWKAAAVPVKVTCQSNP